MDESIPCLLGCCVSLGKEKLPSLVAVVDLLQGWVNDGGQGGGRGKGPMLWVLILARNLPGLTGLGENNRFITQGSIKFFLVTKALHSCQSITFLLLEHCCLCAACCYRDEEGGEFLCTPLSLSLLFRRISK